jgi:hypothetical protein
MRDWENEKVRVREWESESKKKGKNEKIYIDRQTDTDRVQRQSIKLDIYNHSDIEKESEGVKEWESKRMRK